MHKRYNFIERRLVEVADEPALVSVYVNPDESERKYLVDMLELDEHTLHSALDADELPRLEFEPEHMALIVKRPCSYTPADNLSFRVSSAGAFLFKERLVIVMPEEVPLFDSAQLIRTHTPLSLLMQVLQRLIIHFREHLKVISLISDELQDRLRTSMENRYLFNMFTLTKSLVYYVNAISANEAVLDKLKLSAARIGLSTEEIELLEDTAIDNSQCYKQAETYSSVLSSLMDARASVVANNLNVVMKTLTMVTIAIMVPSLVVSIFSMNVPIPMQAHPWGFWIVLGLAFFSGLGFVAYWRKRHW